MNWIESLHLAPHPEGGAFREVFRAPSDVRLADGRVRAALTHIYFHLEKHEHSRFHRVEQDEVWNLYQGDGLRLWIYDEATRVLHELVLSRAAGSFCAVAPVGCWQAAEPLAGPVLVGCTVAPGFDFQDFRMLAAGEKPEPELRGMGLGHLI
jgi:predicted cupin superfamily sugar epimerase